MKLTTNMQVSVDGVVQGNGGLDQKHAAEDSSAADGPGRCSTTRP